MAGSWIDWWLASRKNLPGRVTVPGVGCLEEMAVRFCLNEVLLLHDCDGWLE